MSVNEAKARQIASQKYPNDSMKRHDHMQTLLDNKYYKELCEKYNITEDQMFRIMDEGVFNNWQR